MCGLQFFVQIAVRGNRIHERIVCKRRAETKPDDKAVQLRDRIQLALRVKDFIEYAALFIEQSVFYFRQVIRDVDSQLVRAAAGFDRPRLRINVTEEQVFNKLYCHNQAPFVVVAIVYRIPHLLSIVWISYIISKKENPKPALNLADWGVFIFYLNMFTITALDK